MGYGMTSIQEIDTKKEALKGCGVKQKIMPTDLAYLEMFRLSTWAEFDLGSAPVYSKTMSSFPILLIKQRDPFKGN
ncbi:hypothetical protein C5167_017940 [Papaver somniferum]|uniref:Uncharacterized protein n=1 Tax=Papaver somniferum TaxID=3469 RepID=A0A4Y7IP57_PAPSO|nr:hypothetical protein C5167_017940 [Papaver somniferum]